MAFAWVEGRMKRMHWYDMSALKLCVLAFALLIAKLLPAVLALNAWVYAIVGILLAAYLLWRLR